MTEAAIRQARERRRFAKARLGDAARAVLAGDADAAQRANAALAEFAEADAELRRLNQASWWRCANYTAERLVIVGPSAAFHNTDEKTAKKR